MLMLVNQNLALEIALLLKSVLILIVMPRSCTKQ